MKSSYKKDRRNEAMRIGSEWVFFRRGDDNMKDPWSALEIRIVSAKRDDQSRMILEAECTQPELISETARPVLPRRRVEYSELW